jgi:biopolymer transport protein ExbD
MRRKGLEPMHSSHVNVTPLIDVIMCLIIFFLLCGQFAKEEAKRVTLPVAELGQEIDKTGQLTINLVARDGAGGGEAAPEVFAGAKPVSIERLGVFLRDEQTRNPDLKVMIRADQSLAYSHISPILVACAQANIKSVNFSTRKPE